LITIIFNIVKWLGVSKNQNNGKDDLMQFYPEMQDIDRQSTKTSFLQLFPSIWHIAAKTTSNKF